MAQDTGYDCPFVKEIDPRYQCPICLLVLREPMQTACGHRFCDACIRRVIETNHVLTCPVDKQYSRVNQMFHDVAIQREILSLLVYCTNKPEGCLWRGELRDLETKHRNLCRMEEVECPHGCARKIKRWWLEDHSIECPSRRVQCKHCHEQVVYQTLKEHTDNCPKACVTCQLCGQTDLRREELTHHQHPETGTCEKTVVVCSYSTFGCSFKAERSKMKAHHQCEEVSREHLEMVRKCLSVQDNTMKELKETVMALTRKTEELLPMVQQNQQRNVQISRSLSERNITGRIHWKIKIHQNQRRRGGMDSKVIYTGCPGYKVHLHLDLDGHREGNTKYCTLHLALLAGEYDDELVFPFNATCLVTVYDLSNAASGRRNFTSQLVVREVPRLTDSERAGDRAYRRGISTFMKRHELVGANSRFLRNGCVHLEATILHCFYPQTTCTSTMITPGHSPVGPVTHLSPMIAAQTPPVLNLTSLI